MTTPTMGGAASAPSSTSAAEAASRDVQPRPAAERMAGRKRGPRPRYTPDQIIAALVDANGVKAAAGRFIGCTGATIGNYISAHAEVRAAWDRIRAERHAAH